MFGEGYRMTHLWVFELAAQKPRRLTTGAFTVGSYNWSPDGTQIAFDHRVNSANTSGSTADISVVTVADGRIRPLVTQDGADAGPVWSPDGSKIAFGSAMSKPFSFLNNGQHGSADLRVPTPNAYELYRGLQDVGVPSKLIIYKGFEGIGHGPSKPKSSRAVMQHNLDWFDQYIWGAPAKSTTDRR